MAASWDLKENRTVATLVALVVAGLVSLALCSSARAAGEYEPNDIRDSAHGPLKGGTPYTAEKETDNDVDWYVFYVKAYSQMTFSATMTKQCETRSAWFALYDKDGKLLDGFYAGDLNETGSLHLTMNPGRYYFEVTYRGCTKDRYRFQIDPAASITSSRECGEAIVAKDTVAPLFAEVSEKLSKNGRNLVAKAAAVKKAQKVVRKLRNRRWASRWQKRDARRKLDSAKLARDKVLRARAKLEAIAAQHREALSTAEGQLTTFC